ncbi:MFS transporter [Microbacterium sp. A93]|uniref:MFS transporter n=1 Tax=Microbacterium sp. A93 TaxID=3450716 RepID=UPI003F42B669
MLGSSRLVQLREISNWVVQVKRAVEQRDLRWSVAAALTVVSVFVLSNAPTPLYVEWQREWGFSSGMLTIIFACYMVGLVGTLVVAGRLADRYGRRPVLIPAMLVAILSGALFLLAQGVLWLLVARLLAGIAVGGAVTAGMAAVVDVAPTSRKRAGGLIASTAMVLGAGLGPMLSGVTAKTTATPQLWTFAIITALSITALAVSTGLPLTRPAHAGRTHERRLRWPMPPRDRQRELLWGAATFGPGITATSFVLSLGPSVLAGPIGVPDPLIAGVVACAMFLLATGIQFAAGGLSTRTHLALSSIAAVASMVLLAVTVTVTPWWQAFLAAALLAGTAQGLGQLAGLTLIATRISSERRAESNAALNISGYIPAGVLPVATGYLADAIGLSSAVIVFAAILGAAALIALVVVRISTQNDSTQHAPTKEDDKTMQPSTLVIAAHPDLKKSRVNAAWLRALENEEQITVRSLADARGPHGFDAATEQLELSKHDRVVLQFPFRWYSAPPLLAEWLEVALERGWAYGPGGHALEGKELTIAVSTWSRARDYVPDGRYGRTMDELTSPFATTAARVGMRYRPGFFVHGVGDLSDPDVEETACEYASWVIEGIKSRGGIRAEDPKNAGLRTASATGG